MVRNRVGVAIVGTGVGLRTIAPGLRRTGCADLVALVGRTRQAAEERGRTFGIDLLTDDVDEACRHPDVDLVCVASPNTLHLEHTRAVLRASKHLYLEKPTGRDLAEATAIDDLVSTSPADRLAVVGHQLRFNPYLRAARDLIAAGAIGRVYSLRVEQHASGFTDALRSWSWQFEAAQAGGMRLAMGSHLVDLATFLVGGAMQGVHGHSDAVHVTRRPDGGAPRSVDASASFAALFACGETSVFVSTTAASHIAPRFDVVAYGTDGDITFDLDDKLVLHRLGSPPTRVLDVAADDEWQLRASFSIFSTSFTYFADEIVQALLDGRSTIADAATPSSALDVMRTLDAALETDGPTERVRPVVF